MESQAGNGEVVRRFWEEVFNRGDYDVAEELFAQDHVLHHPAFVEQEEEAQGPDAIKAIVGLFRRVSPDLEVIIDDELAEGDKMVTRWTVSGPLADEIRSPGAGSDRLAVSGISIFSIADGKIKETWKRFEPHLDEAKRRMPPEDLKERLPKNLPVHRLPGGPSPYLSIFCALCPWWC